MNNIDLKHTTAGLKIARILAEKGTRIFTRKEATQVALDSGYSLSFSDKVVLHLSHGGWIEMLRPGLYALSSIFLDGNPIHEFEIANHLAEGTVISHFSAMHHYGYTDQIPHITYATVRTGTKLPRLKKGQHIIVNGNAYHFSQIQKNHFFGHKKIWIGNTRIFITDPERTLIDSLIKPTLCGGIQETLHAFKNNIQEINIEKLVSYALRLDASTAKRLGWVLEKIGVEKSDFQSLIDVSFKGFVLLDSSGEKYGIYNKKWQIQENL